MKRANLAVLLLFFLSYFLRPAGLPADGADFTFVVFPDSQYMVRRHPEIWNSMCRWVVDHRLELNIQAVLTVGDITDSASEREFATAAAGFDLVDAAGIPYLPIMGNHDYDWFVLGRSSVRFDRYFGPARLAGRTWYGGAHPAGGGNHFLKLAVGTRRFLIVGLELYPRPEMVDWAAALIDAHPDHEVIVLTHAYLAPGGRRVSHEALTGPRFFWLPSADASGQDLWEKLVRPRRNIRLVLGGHFGRTPGLAYRSDAGEHGDPVHQLMIDFQSRPNGGDGWIGLLTFRPEPGRIELICYRTWKPSGLGPDPAQPAIELAWP
jgi:hypothetical protein